MITRVHVSTAASLMVIAGASVSAEVFDWDARAGDIMEAAPSTVVLGSGPALNTRRFVPVAIPSTGSLLNASAVRVVDGDILGAVTCFSSTGGENLMWYFETADRFDANGGFTSNNVVLDEFPDTVSDTPGQMLADGRLVFRANYAGATQNNLETILGDVRSQTPAFGTEPNSGDKILTGPGIDGAAGSAFLGVPAAIEGDAGHIWVGNTNYDGGSGGVPVACNIWDYDGTPQSVSTPAYSYMQSAAETFANNNGVVVDPGDGRQSEPAFANVAGVNYVIFGINDTNDGGSGRPAILAIDAFEDGDGFTGAVAILPPSNSRFIDHKATGGGGSPFENKHFDMNSSGQLVVVAESIATVPTYQLLLYNPIISGGRITGFEAPVLIADAGPNDTIPEGLGGPIMQDDGQGGLIAINAISGVGINEAGNIAFTATYDTGEVDEFGDPILSSAAYFYDAANSTLHMVLAQDDVVGNASVGSTITIGLMPQEGSESFYSTSLADDADVMSFTFHNIVDDSRGVLVIVVGHDGDTDFDGDVDQADLGTLLSMYNTSFHSQAYDPEVDFNCDGEIGQQDLGILLANYDQ